MLSDRLTQMRLSRGWSLQDLANAMDSLVTKQALSKYEKGQSTPSAKVLNRLAQVYEVKSSYFLEDPDFSVRLIEFRKRNSLGKKEEKRIVNTVTHLLEERTFFLKQIAHTPAKIPTYRVRTPEEAEQSAEKLRKSWKLGSAPIGNICSVMEEHNIHVLNIDASEKFDGISALIEQSELVIGAAVVSRSNIAGERQRFNLAHELGHIIQVVEEDLEEEQKELFANRFAGAFITPASSLFHRVGRRRKWISEEELKLLKKEFGLSIQALLRRMLDLEIITPSYYTNWCIKINKFGWRKEEPNPLPLEQPTRFAATIYKAFAEEWVSKETAERFLGYEIHEEEPTGLLEKRKLARMSLKDRRSSLEEAANLATAEYEEDQSWKDIQDGDLVEY